LFRARTLAANFFAGLSSASIPDVVDADDDRMEGLVTVSGTLFLTAPFRPTVLPLCALSKVRVLVLLRMLALSAAPRLGVRLPVPVPVPVPVRLEAPVPVVVEDRVECVEAEDPVGGGRFRVSTLARMEDASDSASIRDVCGWCDMGRRPRPDLRPAPMGRPGLFRCEWVPPPLEDGCGGLGLRRSSIGTSMSRWLSDGISLV
jgi:hypothetical protein